MSKRIGLTVWIIFTLSACVPQTPAVPTLEPTSPPLFDPTPTSTPEPEAEPDPRPEAAIMILEPGPGSRVVSPVRVSGIADPTFEQTLVVRIVLVDGSVLAEAPTTIAADLGERGPFEIDLDVRVPANDEQAFIQVYAVSARDGGVVALASVGVQLALDGPEEIVTVLPYREPVYIRQPVVGATVGGGIAHVEGFGQAGFEQTLVVEVLDEAGDVVGSLPITLSGEMGEPGPFRAAVSYAVTTMAPGRIVVRDVSPAFGGDAHLSSVEVTLAP